MTGTSWYGSMRRETGLRSEQGVRAEGLLEEKRVVVDAEVRQLGGTNGVELRRDGFDLVVWRDEVDLDVAKALGEAA